MKCPQCGATMEAPAAGTSSRCRYCNAVVDGPKPSAADPFDNLFADRNGNGIPDAIEGMMRNPGAVNLQHTRSTSYTVNGVRYERLEDVPPHLRALLEGAQGLLGGAQAKPDAGPAFQGAHVRFEGKVSSSPSLSRLWILLAVVLAVTAGIAAALLLA